MSGDFSRRALLGGALGLSFETGLRARSVPPQDERGGQVLGPLHRAAHGLGPSQTAPGSPLAADPRAGEEWDAALLALRAAEEAVAGEEGRQRGCSAEEEDAEAYGLLLDRLDAALDGLWAAAAPEVAALALKIELAVAFETGSAEEVEGPWGAVLADARRLVAASA